MAVVRGLHAVTWIQTVHRHSDASLGSGPISKVEVAAWLGIRHAALSCASDVPS